MAQSTGLANRAGRSASAWIERLARIGYAVKGGLYILIGFLAVKFALGESGAPASSQQAMEHVQALPGGGELLWPIAIGLAGYALWMLLEALLNPESEKVGHRLGGVLSSIVHGGLAWSAFRLAMHEAGPRGHAERAWTARVLAEPFGAVLVAAVGLGVAGFGVWQIARALAGRLHDLEHAAMSGEARRWTLWLGRAGQAARGLVFGIGGVFLISAAVQSDAREARGLGEVLRSVAQQPFGHALLIVVAAGLAAYGLYMLAMARFRRVEVHGPG